ncbi:cytochrome c oxidase subunit 2, partial (mitochondrion) [Candidozyma auris]
MGYFLFVSLSVRKDIKLRKLRDYRLIANDITLILAFPIPDDMLEEGQLRLLDTDTSIIVPVDTHVRFIVTANDLKGKAISMIYVNGENITFN